MTKEPLGVCDWTSIRHEKNEHKIEPCRNWRPVEASAPECHCRTVQAGPEYSVEHNPKCPRHGEASAPVVTAAKDMSAQALESGALGEADAPTEVYAANDGTWVKGSAPAAPPRAEDAVKKCGHPAECVQRACNHGDDCVCSFYCRWCYELDCAYKDAAPKAQTEAAIEEAVRVEVYKHSPQLSTGGVGCLCGWDFNKGFLSKEFHEDWAKHMLNAILPILRSGK